MYFSSGSITNHSPSPTSARPSSLPSRQTAASLEAESGLQLESLSITSFRQAVLNGDWKNSEKHLLQGLKDARTRSMRYDQTSMIASGSSRVSETGGAREWELVLRDPGSKGFDVSC